MQDQRSSKAPERSPRQRQHAAEQLAIAALGFIAGEPERLGALPRADRHRPGVDPGGGARAGVPARRARSRRRRRSLAARLRAASPSIDPRRSPAPAMSWPAQRPKCPDRSCYIAVLRHGASAGDRDAQASAATAAATCRTAPAAAAAAARRGSLRHPELDTLAIAHVDCDAFYATIEKRDDPVARRQAGDHRRRQARRGAHRLLRRAHLRRALGDADVRGAAALPARQSSCRPDMDEIRARRPRGARADARADAAGRAAVDRRGVHGSLRHRAAARHGAGEGAGALRRRGRARDRHHRLDRARRATSSSPRSPPTSTSRAALRCSAAREAAAFLAPTSR